MLQDEQISKYRAEVIERAINIEWLISAIISQHYFGYVSQPFLLEVLYDEYFNFALKRRILEKVIDNNDKKKLQDLNRINTIRNYFAHCNQRVVDGPDPQGKARVVDPRNIEKAIDFEKLYTEFTNLAGGIENYLFAIYTAKGGIAIKE